VFGLIVTIGFLIDLFIYTLWLKRLTPFSILWGGISGGMPAMAGRVLALGHVDSIGVLFALSIILWIPSHILTLIMYHAKDYEKARVPVWPNLYGLTATRRLIAAATLLNAVVFAASGLLLGIHRTALLSLVLLSVLITGVAVWCAVSPHERHDFMLFKAASCYMLLSFVLLTAGALLR
jgi:protoheme IX farnesyltransferase